MKGVAPIILIGLVALVSLVVTGGIAANVLIGGQTSQEEARRELEVLVAVNKVESVKRGLPYALYYSFSEAMKTNNFSSVQEINDSINFASNVNTIFNEYRNVSEGKIGVRIPSGEIRLDIIGNEAVLDFSSVGLLSYESPSTKISDNPNVTIKISGSSLVE